MKSIKTILKKLNLFFNSFSSATQAVIYFLAGSLVTLSTLYFGSYLQATIDQKNILANDLANYYSASASIFYSERDRVDFNGDNNSPFYIELLKEDNDNYQKFTSATTKLAFEVSPDLREKILSIESNFNDMKDINATTSEDEWLTNLYDIRDSVLDRINYKKSLNPTFK